MSDEAYPSAARAGEATSGWAVAAQGRDMAAA